MRKLALLLVSTEAAIRYVDRFISTPTQPLCRWLNWGAWGECTGVCGHGIQKRLRRCIGGVAGDDNCCPGDDCDHKPCMNPVGDTCAYWSGWSEWSSCSTSCGAGVRTKLRTCYGEDIAKGYTCDGSTTREEPCLIGNGQYLAWSAWSSCSATCGDAIRTRSARHTCDVADNQEVQSCDLLDCCDPLPWSDWSACSATCFTGTQLRTHGWTCDYKADVTETRSCNAGDGFYSDWAPWGACSQTCTGGYQQRVRTHSCGETDYRGVRHQLAETQACGFEGQWSLWSDYSECSSTCPNGSMRRARQHECTNVVENDVATCGFDGFWLEWSEWSGCSSSCVGGVQYRRRSHSCSPETDVEQQACGDVGTWLEWSQYSSCSQTCVGGSQVRTRFHSCGNAAVLADIVTSVRETESAICGAVGQWSQWTVWSGCSRSCGGGQTTRLRYHDCSGETEEETQLCNDTCCPAWNEWTEWTPCSASCGRGEQQRSKSNVCPEITDYQQTRTCVAILPDDPYTMWAEWQACSSSCVGGRRIRSAEHICGATARMDAEACGQPGFWMEWSQWSGCSVTCGLGQMSRQRGDSCGSQLPEFEMAECNGGPGVYSEWSSWSVCSTECPGGVSRRYQYHDCGAEANVEERTCGTDRWSLWTTWSACSSTCSGLRTRRQINYCGAQPIVEDEACGSGGAYLSWSPWSICSQECQGGLSTRSRGHSCGAPAEEETKQCGRAAYYGVWSAWSQCSDANGALVLCNGGLRRRSRSGYCGALDEVQDVECNTQRCCYNTPWSEWSACSTSCGSGYQQRQINDCDGEPVQFDRQVCTNVVTVSDWSEWGACSASCGNGMMARTRSGPCTRPEEQLTKCRVADCPYYGAWTAWSACTATCGSGQISRSRVCYNGVAGVDCLGDEFENMICTASDPGFNPWSDWSDCTKTCGGGTMSRSRSHICTGIVDEQIATCNINPGAWSAWSPWATCSATCGGGSTFRNRYHSCTGESEEQTMTCNNHSGSYGAWSAWSACSASCYGGSKFRSRSHNCGLADDVQTVVCGSTGSYTLWSAWSSCPSCYDVGESPVMAQRSRGHSCSTEQEVQEKTCTATRCAYWAQWGRWGACSTTCGSGFRVRVRACVGSTEFCNTLFGDREETETCNGGFGVDVASTWSPCSASCGTGVQTRSISNTCTDEVRFESQACASSAGYYGHWTAWSACSATCGGGLQQRRRDHSCGEAPYVQERSCSLSAGSWGSWGEWSACPVSCGGANVVRTRFHSCTGEVDSDSKFCNTHPCAYYGAWSNWSPCSASCGLGTMSRIRYCHGGQVGEGLCLTGDVTTNEVVSCDMGSCCDFDWSGWTGCCRDTQNNNVRLRFRGGCEGSTAPQEVSKPCDQSGIVSDSCLVVIQNSLELGIIGTGYNMTYVINPDEYINFSNQILTGQRLGHDEFATSHSLQVPVTGTMTTGHQWSTGGHGHFPMMFDGQWILSDELISQQHQSGTVTGLMINGIFVEGKFITRDGLYQFIGGQTQLIGSSWQFVEGRVNPQTLIFENGSWQNGVFVRAGDVLNFGQGWTTSDQSWSTTGSSMVFDGKLINLDQVVYQQHESGTISGLIIDGAFVEGKFYTRNGTYQFVGGQTQLIGGSWQFIEGRINPQSLIFELGTWNNGLFTPL